MFSRCFGREAEQIASKGGSEYCVPFLKRRLFNAHHQQDALQTQLCERCVSQLRSPIKQTSIHGNTGRISGCLINAIDVGFVLIFEGEIFSITFHCSWAPGPFAGRTPIANINNQSCKSWARHHSNPECIWQQNRAETERSGTLSSNQSKVFQNGKSVWSNYHSLREKRQFSSKPEHELKKEKLLHKHMWAEN